MSLSSRASSLSRRTPSSPRSPVFKSRAAIQLQRRPSPPDPEPPLVLNLNNNIKAASRSDLQDAEERKQFTEEKDPTCCEIWNPKFTIGLVYFVATMMFLVGMNVKHFTLLRYPWVGNLLDYENQFRGFDEGVIILQVLWCAHFVRKCCQTLFLNNYQRKISLTWFTCMAAFYGFFGLWIGFSVNLYNYLLPKPAFIFLGIVVFVIGEAGNFVCFWMLRNNDNKLRPSGMVAHTRGSPHLPDAVIFGCMTSPQFMFEVVSWVGFYISAQTLAVAVFTLAISLLVSALAVANWFQQRRSYTVVNGDAANLNTTDPPS